MSRRIINTNIRLNLDNEEDRRSWEYLQGMDRAKFRSYSRAVVAALNDFFDRQERMKTDSYLETREKENAFLQKVLDTIERGLRSMVPPDSPPQGLVVGQPASPAASSPEDSRADADTERDEAENTLMDFIDSF